MQNNPSNPPKPFQFDATLSPEENIELFLQMLTAKNATLADVLRKHLPLITPLPGDTQARAKARSAFNLAVVKSIDASGNP